MFTFRDVTTLLLTYLSIPILPVKECENTCTQILSNYVNDVTPRALHDIAKNEIYIRSKSYDLIEHVLSSDVEFA